MPRVRLHTYGCRGLGLACVAWETAAAKRFLAALLLQVREGAEYAGSYD